MEIKSIKSVDIVEVRELGHDKFKYITYSGMPFFAKGISLRVGMYDLNVYEDKEGRKIIDKATPVTSQSTQDTEEIIQIPQSDNTLRDFNSPLLESIWQSPALGTQPGNPDEILKIAKQWYEESLKWLK